MGVFAGPDVSENGLVLAVDGANAKSFKGEPTTNLTRNSRDFSGTAYASDDQWVDNPSVLSKTYISSIVTPVGNGATLIQESGSNGYHHLSRWGGGEESGAHSLSCYVFPLTSDITDFVIGMLADGGNQISFNLNTRAITYGPGISNRDAFITPVVGFDGWYKVGANIEGRSGGWVGCIGYTTSSVYTGTSGNKKCYITGIQYESKTKPTMFVEAQTTRGSTVATGGGWADLSGNGNNGELVNGVRESSDNLGSLVFDGTDDYITLSNTLLVHRTSNWTYSCWVNFSGTPSLGTIFENGSWTNCLLIRFETNGITIYSMSSFWGKFNLTPTLGIWYKLDFVRNGNNIDFYLNGSYSQSIAFTADIQPSSNLFIGMSQHSAGQCFNGKIANASVYTKALSATEIKQNYNATKSRYGL